MNTENSLYTKKQKMDIYSGGNIVLTAVIAGLLGSIPMFSNWFVGLIIMIVGIVANFILNVKKFKLIENEKIVTFKRAVIIDGVLVVIALGINWFYNFVPYPFTWQKFLSTEPRYEFHIMAAIIGCFFIIPTMLTNKKIIIKE